MMSRLCLRHARKYAFTVLTSVYRRTCISKMTQHSILFHSGVTLVWKVGDKQALGVLIKWEVCPPLQKVGVQTHLSSMKLRLCSFTSHFRPVHPCRTKLSYITWSIKYATPKNFNNTYVILITDPSLRCITYEQERWKAATLDWD